VREWWSKLIAMARGRRTIHDDLAEEIQSNLELAAEDRIAHGQSAEEARLAARRNLGNATLIRERASDAWSFVKFETFLQDLRYGLRGIRRSPAYSLVVILTLALAIGANTAIFSVVNSVLLKPLPYPDSERLVRLGESSPTAQGFSITWGNFRAWQKYNRSFEDMAGFEWNHFTLTGREQPLLITAMEVGHGFLNLLGAKPLLGRTFTAEEDHAGAVRTAVLDYGFWSTKMAADASVLGTTLDLDGLTYRVIGVLPPGFKFNGSVTVDLYVPIGVFKSDAAPRGAHGSMRILARLRPSVTLSAARTDLDRIMQRLAQEDPGTESDHRSEGEYLLNDKTEGIRPTLWILMGAVGFILLIACSNVANLVLARSAARSREVAIRTAIGAGRIRLVRQVLTENLLIASIGGALGLALGFWALRALILMAPTGIPRLDEVSLDLRALLFTAAVTILTGLLVGFAPVFTAGKVDLATSLNAGGRSGTDTKRERSFRNVLVVAEITVTLVLAFGSGVLLRSLIVAQNSSPGFVPEHLLSLELVLPDSSYKDRQSVQNFFGSLEQGLRSLPGVQSVGTVFCPPPAGDCSDWWYSILGGPVPAKSDVPLSYFNYVDPDYFGTMGIALTEGRGFGTSDRAGSPAVAIVNEVVARRWFPKASAVGHLIKLGGPYMPGPTIEIVGVTANVRQEGFGTESGPEIYQPFAQHPQRGMAVMIRTAGDPNALISAVRRLVVSLDHNLPIQRVASMEDRLAATLERRKFTTLLLAIFAGLALSLSAVGVYGLLSYWVMAREEEIAIRQALGASRARILAWAAASAARLVAGGIVLGLLAAWPASSWLKSLVFGISPHDTAMMIAAASVVIGIAALSAAIPLARAIRVDAARKLQRA